MDKEDGTREVPVHLDHELADAKNSRMSKDYRTVTDNASLRRPITAGSQMSVSISVHNQSLPEAMHGAPQNGEINIDAKTEGEDDRPDKRLTLSGDIDGMTLSL